MNTELQRLEIKVENNGATLQGRLSATEWNIVVAALKSLDASGGNLDPAAILKIVHEAGYVTREDIADIALQTIVTTTTEQKILAVKDFDKGFKIGGLPIYKLQDDTIYFDCNLVVRGGITARGTKETITPSIFEALPIDGDTIKRTADGRLYVDADALNISGGGGVADSVSWENVTDKPSWIGSTKPTYTPKEIGALGVLDTALNSLSLGGYAHDNYLRWESMAGVSVDLNQVFDLSVKSVQNSVMNYPSASPYGVLLSLPYRNASGNAIPDFGVQLYFANGDDALPNAYWRDSYASGYKNWRTILDSSNYSDYALPITGNAVSATSAKYLSQSNIQESINYPRGTDHAIKVVNCTSPKQDGFFSDYTTVLSVASPLSNFQLGVYANPFSTRAPRPRFRAMRNTDSVWTDWKELAFVEDLSAYLPLTGGAVTGGITLGDVNTDDIALQVVTKAGRISFGKDLNGGYIWSAGAGYFMSFRDDGNVSVGGVTADERLHVHGNLLVAGGITARYTSDMRLKQNRRSFKASEVLMSLGAVQQFEYIPSEVEKNKIYEGTHIGLIYQNVVGTALHRMCHEREDGYGSLNYLEPSFISLLAGVGQEHEVRIQQLERENKTLKEEVEKLRKRVA